MTRVGGGEAVSRLLWAPMGSNSTCTAGQGVWVTLEKADPLHPASGRKNRVMSDLVFGRSRRGWRGPVREACQGTGGTASLQARLSPHEVARKSRGEHVHQIVLPIAFRSLITFPVLISSSCLPEPSSALFLGWISPPPHPLFTSLPLFQKVFHLGDVTGCGVKRH